jgi:hypothetical protein
MSSSAAKKTRDKAVSYHVLLDRVNTALQLRNLLAELLFMVSYVVFFLAFVFLQAQTESLYEVNIALTSTFADTSFPSSTGVSEQFTTINDGAEWVRWFDNVAFPVISSTRYESSGFYDLQSSEIITNCSDGVFTNTPSSVNTTLLPTTSPTFFNSTQGPSSIAPTAPVPSIRNCTNKTVTLNSRLPVGTAQQYFAVLWQKQVRVYDGTNCVVAPNFLWNSVKMARNGFNSPFLPSTNPVNATCYPPYEPEFEQTATGSFPSMFQYFSRSPIGAVGYLGAQRTWYPSNGWYSDRVSYANFRDWPLIEQNFITAATRFVGVNGVIYNPTYNVWSTVGMFTEFQESGLVESSYDVSSAPLMYCSYSVNSTRCTGNPAELAMASITGIFVIVHFFVLVLFRRAVAFRRIMFSSGDSIVKRTLSQKLKRLFWDIFDFWVALDIAQFALGLVTLIYIGQVYWSATRFSTLSNINLLNVTMSDASTVMYYLHEYTYMQQIFGSQIILFNIQVFKYFPALPCFGLVRRGWYNIYMEIIRLFIMYWVLILCYAFVGWISFGQFILLFSSYANSLNAVIRMILGEPSFDVLRIGSPAFAWIYLLFFIIVFVYTLQALFLSIVIDGFRTAFSEMKKHRTSFRELMKKQTRYEFYERLKQWKMRKANENAEYITWSQLKEALRGHVHNRIDVSDEQVDEVFRLVHGDEYISADLLVKGNKPTVAVNDENNLAPGENRLLMPQLIRTMFDIKSDEQTFLKQLGMVVNKMRESQEHADQLLRRADAASTRFVKDDSSVSVL